MIIKAYEDSMKLAKEEVARRLADATNSANKKKAGTNQDNDASSSSASSTKGERKFKIGDFCRATYEDGIDYEAKVMGQDAMSRKFLIKYIGYDNEEFVDGTELLPSWGKRQRKQQKLAAQIDKDQDDQTGVAAGAQQMSFGQVLFDRTKEGNLSSSSQQPKLKKSSKIDPAMNLMFPPPPPMPPMIDENMEDAEHLSAMLMSWYMSGYYTGLYQGQKLAQKRSQP